MQRISIFIVPSIFASIAWLAGGDLIAKEQPHQAEDANLTSPASAARIQLARKIRRNKDLPEVLEKAKSIIKTGFNAGDGYGEVWIRDLATFIELACEVNDSAEIKQNLLMFFRFQGDDGSVIDGFVPTSKANVNYRYIKHPRAPGFLGHKNTVETDQESSLIQAVHSYVQATGDRSILRDTIDGKTVLARMELALEFLLTDRFAEEYGLLWGATTADWGDVQPEHEWGVVLDESSHRAIDVYDNAMFLVAVSNYASMEPKSKPRWDKISQDFRRKCPQAPVGRASAEVHSTYLSGWLAVST